MWDGVEVSQEATFTVDAYPERTFRGRVSEVRNAPTTIQNVVTYDVVIQVGNKDFKLKPGMTANVSVLIAHKEGVLKIPNAALRFQPPSAKKEETGEKKKEGSSPSGQQWVERLSGELILTEEQRSKVETVLKASRQEIPGDPGEGKTRGGKGSDSGPFATKDMGVFDRGAEAKV